MAGTVAPNIVTDGLVLYLDPSNPRSYISSSSTITDLINPNTSGTWINGIPNLQQGKLIISTSTNYLSSISGISQSAFPQASGSVSIWVNALYGFSGAGGQGYFDSYDLTRNHIFIRSANGGNQIALQISGAASYNVSYTLPSPQPNTWYNYVVTYITGTSRNFKVYSNGVLLVNGTPASASWVPDGQYVGYGLTNNIMSGSYGSLSVYNRVLTEQEVLQNYNATKTRFGL
jgi:hypothetical protein